MYSYTSLSALRAHFYIVCVLCVRVCIVALCATYRSHGNKLLKLSAIKTPFSRRSISVELKILTRNYHGAIHISSNWTDSGFQSNIQMNCAKSSKEKLWTTQLKNNNNKNRYYSVNWSKNYFDYLCRGSKIETNGLSTTFLRILFVIIIWLWLGMPNAAVVGRTPSKWMHGVWLLKIQFS